MAQTINFKAIREALSYPVDTHILIDSKKTGQPLKILVSEFLQTAVTLGLLPGNNANFGNVLFVTEEGVDADAVKGDLSKAWKSIIIAKEAASSGDTIIAYGNHNIDGVLGTGSAEENGTVLKDGVNVFVTGNLTSSIENSMFYDLTGKVCIVQVLGKIQNTSGDNDANFFWNIDLNHDDADLTLSCSVYEVASLIGKVGSGVLNATINTVISNGGGHIECKDPLGDPGTVNWTNGVYYAYEDPIESHALVRCNAGTLNYKGTIMTNTRGIPGNFDGSVSVSGTGVLNFEGDVIFFEDTTVALDLRHFFAIHTSGALHVKNCNVTGINGLFGCPFSTLIRLRDINKIDQPSTLRFGNVYVKGDTDVAGAVIYDNGSHNDVDSEVSIHFDKLVAQEGRCLLGGQIPILRLSGYMKTLEDDSGAHVLELEGSGVIAEELTLVKTNASAEGIFAGSAYTMACNGVVRTNGTVNANVTTQVSSIIIDTNVK